MDQFEQVLTFQPVNENEVSVAQPQRAVGVEPPCPPVQLDNVFVAEACKHGCLVHQILHPVRSNDVRVVQAC